MDSRMDVKIKEAFVESTIYNLSGEIDMLL